ncbi:T9SS type A sorting domain-containing protein [Hymenobacter busanensis]|uniref:T9SS type A sorting domain-containing protein n=1 Tax=Hymenobacter busanensis TaxID=2607656 RepID=A0A7L4ZTV5_9BACT|nr:T9SS type A sorting domain-containing protein [Hymenobacter busanensis]KAA9339380.1 T9SS type A sorting domain-containing protein [Hymenobacter busanensis]QHJ06859.1 T9SS type A sorting domain-containing protein [Hymenobacter busanensis]
MNKMFTLAAAGLLATASLSAQAQVTVDGVINATEIGAANTGRYVSLGRFTTPHPAGFGGWGLLQMYGANTSTKLHLALAGTLEKNTNGNGFHLYIDLPNLTGLPQGTVQPAIAGSGTVFERGGAKFDMPVDLALGIEGDAAGMMLTQGAVYTSATAAVSQDFAPMLSANGTASTLSAASTGGSFSRFAGARMAYRDTPAGDVLTNPGNPTGGAGSYGWEVELDRTALGLPSGASVVRVFGAYVSGSGYWSTDVIPEIPGRTTNLEFDPDFTALGGTQAANLNVVVLSNKKAADAVVAMSVFPNPSANGATVTYQVADKSQQVQVVLTDLMGRTVRVLRNEMQTPGFKEEKLNSGDVASGSYLVKVQVGDKVATRKVSLL